MRRRSLSRARRVQRRGLLRWSRASLTFWLVIGCWLALFLAVLYLPGRHQSGVRKGSSPVAAIFPIRGARHLRAKPAAVLNQMPSTEAEALGADEWALLDLPDIPAVPASSEPAGSVITYELFARPHLLSFAAQFASGRPLASRSPQPAGGGGGGGNRSGGSGGTGGGGGAGAEGGTGSGIDETRVETALFPTEPATLDVAEDLGPGGSSGSWPQSDPSASTAHLAMLSSNGQLPAWIAPQVSSPWFAHSFETARAGRTERGGASAAGDWDPYAGISRLLPYFAAANPEPAATGVDGLTEPDLAPGSAESPLAETGPSALLLLLPDEPQAGAAMLLEPPAAAVSEGNVPEPASVLMVALAAAVVLVAWKFRQ